MPTRTHLSRPLIDRNDTGDSTVSRTIRQLKAMSLDAEDGAYLGSENDLIRHLQVSRPTLRQAAKVLENERLLSVRRGVTGGLYAERPSMRDVVRLPALWLRIHDATLQDMQLASGAILSAVSASAATSDDPALFEELAALRDAIARAATDNDTEREMTRTELRLIALLSDMSGNPVLMLFVDIAYGFGLLDRDLHFYDVAHRRATWRQLQLQLCDAVLARDPDIAMVIQTRRHRIIASWLAEPAA